VQELRRRGGSGQGVKSEVTWGGVGGEGVYDTNKMFRSCGKMTAEGFASTGESADSSPVSAEDREVGLPSISKHGVDA
jgi:hypothetical protein